MSMLTLPFAIVLAPSHFTAAVLFAVFTSIVFAITQRSGVREQVRYGFYCFGLFVGGVFVAGWLMLLLRR
jgi:hypothetical protein